MRAVSLEHLAIPLGLREPTLLTSRPRYVSEDEYDEEDDEEDEDEDDAGEEEDEERTFD